MALAINSQDSTEHFEDVQKVYEIFEEIKETSGKNDKIKIIQHHKDNNLFQFFLQFLYDDLVKTGLDTKKINKNVKPSSLSTYRGFNHITDLMNHLSKFPTGRDKIIFEVQQHLRQYPEHLKQFLSQVLTKKYKNGCNTKTVNKAYGFNFVNQFDVMLAHPYEKYADKLDEEFHLSIKLDGHRTVAFYDGKNVEFRTRKGHLVEGLSEIERDIKRVFSNRYQFISDEEIVLDGEIIASGVNPKEDDVFKETSKIIRTDGEKTGLEFHIFDALPRSEFNEGESVDSYWVRKSKLDTIIKEFDSINDSKTRPSTIKEVPSLYVGKDKEVIPNYLEKAIENGEEGLMLNTSSGKYKLTRSKDILKIKKFEDVDCLVVDIFEGTSKYEGKMGGVVISYKGYEIGVGSGFTDQEREYYWNNPEEIVGEVIEVQHFGESTNSKSDNLSLRFPTFRKIHESKTEEDLEV